jgi:hypothetical protein
MQPQPAAHPRALYWLAMLLLASCSSMCAFPGSQELPVGTDIHRYDPVAAYPAILAVAGSGHQLSTLDTWYVREDGTQDLAASYVSASQKDVAQYNFIGPQKGRDPNTPVGAGPADAPRSVVDVKISEPRSISASINNQPQSNYKHLGMMVSRYDSTVKPDTVQPPCPFSKLWTIARTKGAPAGAVAQIRYSSRGYEFKIEGTPVDLRFDTSCALKTNP